MHCLSVADYPGVGVALQTDQGVAGWTHPGAPSYSDCANLLAAGPRPAVGLATDAEPSGVAAGGWLCALGHAGETLRHRYDGADQPGNNYTFAITGYRSAPGVGGSSGSSS